MQLERVVFFVGVVASILGLAACDSKPAPTSAADSPRVSGTAPAPFAEGVDGNIAITATFDRAMDATSLSASTFGLRDVTGTVSYDAASRTVTFSPDAPLARGRDYVATVAQAVRSSEGGELGADFTWIFSTAPRVRVTSTHPLDGAADVPAEVTIEVAFSGPIDAGSVNETSLSIVGVAGSATYDADTGRALFQPEAPLLAGGTYVVEVEGIMDTHGDAIEPMRFFFSVPVPPDETSPFVAAVTPSENATDVAVDTAVTVTFSEAMDPATLDETTFSLRDGASGDAVLALVSYGADTSTAKLVPASPLAYATSYTATIGAGATDLAGNSLATAYAWTFTTSAAPDVTPPFVTATSPLDATVGVSYLLGAVTATFNEAMDAASIDGSTFLVVRDGNSTVAGSVGYDDATRTASFVPAVPLSFSSTYTAVISGGVRDVAGNAMGSAAVLSFTVESDTYPPTVVTVSPADGETDVARESVVTVVFSEPMDPSTMTSWVLYVTDGQYSYGGTPTYDAATTTLTWTPQAPLPFAKTLTATLFSAAADASGNRLESDYSWSFTVVPDLVPPTVVSTTPSVDAVDVVPSSTISATFDEPMDAGTLTAASFLVSNGVTGTVSYDSTTRTVTFRPSTWLRAATAFTATLTTEVKDAQGNSLASPFAWSFTTATDTTPPIVTATHPVDGARLISPDSSVVVTFSEPMDASTLTASTLTVSGSSGTVSYDPTTWTATFTPSVRFAAGSTKTVTVSAGAKDVEGNPLASASSWTFHVVRSPVQISGGASALHDGVAMAFAPSGDGIAVWRVNAGGSSSGARIVASSYLAASRSWSPEVVLGDYDSGAVSAPAVATNGTTFLAVWSANASPATTYAAIGSGGAWGAAEPIAASYNSSLKAVSNGSGYAVLSAGNVWVRDAGAWTETALTSGYKSDIAGGGGLYAVVFIERVDVQDSVKARVWAGGAWGDAAAVSTTSYTPSTSVSMSGLAVVSNGTGFGACWYTYWSQYGSSGETVSTSTYASGAWTAGGGAGGYVRSPMIASNGSGYALGYVSYTPTATRCAYVRLYTPAGGWGASTALGTPDYRSYSLFGLSGSAGGYGAAWSDGSSLYGSLYASGAWSAASTLATFGTWSSVAQARTGSTQAVVWARDDGAVMASLGSGGTFTTGTVQAAGGASPAALAITTDGVSGYQAVWTRAAALNASRREASWATPVDLVTGTYPGHALSPKVALTPGGDGLIVWLQYDGGVQGIWARPYAGGALGTPAQVSPTARDFDVATNGTAFVVVWRDGTSGNLVSARRYVLATSSWDAPVAIKTSAGSVWAPAVASGDSGFLLAYPGYSSITYNTSADGQTWSGDQTTSAALTGLRLVSNGSSILALGPNNSMSASLIAIVYSSGAWGAYRSLGAVPSYGQYFDAAPHGTGFVVAWSDGSSKVQAATFDAAWTTTTLASSWGSGSAAPSVASDGATAVVLYRNGYNDLQTRELVAGAWSDPTAIEQSGAGPLAATDTDFAGIHVRTDGVEPGLSSNSRPNGVWDYAGGFVDGLSGAVSSPQLKSTSTAYYLIWARQSPDDNAGQIWGSLGS